MGRAPARERLRGWLSGHHRHVTPLGALTVVLLGAGLTAAALAGDGWSAGFSRMSHIAGGADWRWLPVAVVAMVVSHAGYAAAYRQVLHHGGGPSLPMRHVGASVVAGFGLLIPRAGFVLDRTLWRDHGLSEQAARTRVLTLSVLEYALLAPAAFVAALVLLSEHFPAQAGVLPSWVIGVPAGSLLALGLLALRRRPPLRRRGWAAVGRGLDAVRSMADLVRTPTGAQAAVGMAAYWAADIAVLGACLAALHPGGIAVDRLVVGYASGYALTRRALPFAGAGAAEALLPFGLYWVGVPLPTAVLAVLAYRLCTVWLPLLPAALSLYYLRSSADAEGPAA